MSNEHIKPETEFNTMLTDALAGDAHSTAQAITPTPHERTRFVVDCAKWRIISQPLGNLILSPILSTRTSG